MATRRSKRFVSTSATPSLSEDTDAPVRKRRAKKECEPDTKPEKPSSTRNKSSSDVKIEIENSAPVVSGRRSARNSVKNTKSSYFESPVASEDSQSEDDEFTETDVRNRKSSAGLTKGARSKFQSSDESDEEYDSESEIFQSPCKRKSRVNGVKSRKKAHYETEKENGPEKFPRAKSSVDLVRKIAQSCAKSFESESDSSSEDEDAKLAQKTEPNSSSSVPLDPLDLDSETAAADDNKSTEFFDFSAVVSQITQTSSEKDEEPAAKQIMNVKPEPEPTTSSKKKSQAKKARAVTKEKATVKTEGMEVFELLAMGEKTDMSAKDIKESVSKVQEEYEVPKQVEVLLDTPVLKKKKKCDDLEMALRRRLNNIRRENQVYIHKAHVLCWIAHGNYLNRILNSADLLGTALSLIPSDKCYPPKRMEMEHLERLIKWFAGKVVVRKDPIDSERVDLIVSLCSQFEKSEADSKLDLCFMFICVLRALGIKCRLIINLNVAPIKPTSEQLLPVVQKQDDDKLRPGTSAKSIPDSRETKNEKNGRSQKSVSKESGKSSEKKSATFKIDVKEKSVNKESGKSSEKKSATSKIDVKEKSVNKESGTSSEKKRTTSKVDVKEKSVSGDARKKNETETRRSSRVSNPKSSYFEDKASDDEESKSERIRSRKSTSKIKDQSSKKKPEESESVANENRRSSRRTKSKYFEKEASDDEERKTKSTKRSSEKKVASKMQKSKEDALVEEMSTSDSDGSSDEFRTPKKKKNRKVISTDDEVETANEKDDAKSRKQPRRTNYWLEVFLEAEEKWASVDIVNKKYLCDDELSKNASAPVRYILAWNNDQTIKDVTKRYARQFLTVTRKLRADEDWWTRTMAPFKPFSTPQEREEDEELDKKLEEQPLPKTISEYKNHPLYALKRHLLKFQAIYPPDAVPLGYIGKDNEKEPVYSRVCVHQLHGREMWIKEAKVVKLNETPYKIVKGRQKRDKYGTGEGPRDLELFGLWQVEDYVPPAAENGKVPRNAFGNVELFKMSMLPKGTVYLQIPGLQRIANKLNIDCAQAITGFEYSTNGWSYPVKDGFVVCEEFKDILLDAFNQEVEEAEKKEKQKREDRVYGNWKRLIRGMFIAEKLKRKYNFGSSSSTKDDEEPSTSQKAATKTK